MAPPLVSHRGQPGRWQNTLDGVKIGLLRGWAGVEIDVVTTADGVPVLSHDPWLTPGHVAHADGRPIGKHERILVKDLTLERLRREFRFGVDEADDTFVGPTTLADVLELLRGSPAAILYLDVKIERPELALTHDAEATASAIFALLRAAKLDNPIWIEGGSKDIVATYRRLGHGLTFNVALSFPRFDADQNDVVEVVGAGLEELLHIRDPGQEALDAGAESFASHRNFTTKLALRQAHAAGVPGILFGIDSAHELRTSVDLPVRFLIVDDTPGVADEAGIVATA